MLNKVLDRLLDAGVAHVGPPPEAFDVADPIIGALPTAYFRTLERFNGFSVHAGANRLFGMRSEPHLDVRAWNRESNWRFAWDQRTRPFLCIGETLFGDQYALRRSEVPGEFLPEVYLLEANFLEPEVIASSFGDFLEQEFLRNAVEPYDPMAVAAVRQIGPVDPAKNLVYTPSLALGGPEDISHLVVLDAFTAMVIAGDIVQAIDSAPDDAVLAGVAPWTDESGRSRLRVEFRQVDPTHNCKHKAQAPAQPEDHRQELGLQQAPVTRP